MREAEVRLKEQNFSNQEEALAAYGCLFGNDGLKSIAVNLETGCFLAEEIHNFDDIPSGVKKWIKKEIVPGLTKPATPTQLITQFIRHDPFGKLRCQFGWEEAAHYVIVTGGIMYQNGQVRLWNPNLRLPPHP